VLRSTGLAACATSWRRLSACATGLAACATLH